MIVTLNEYMAMKGIRKASLVTLLLSIKCRLLYPGFDAVVIIRKQQMSNNKILKEYYARKLLRKYNIEISTKAVIGNNLRIEHMPGIVIGDGVVIGNNLHLYQNVTIGQKNGNYPVIGDNVTIYPGAKVFGDIIIGNNAVIGANAVVQMDVPEYGVVAGVPARLLRIDNIIDKNPSDVRRE